MICIEKGGNLYISGGTCIDFGCFLYINDLILQTKHGVGDRFRFYSQDLINNLFSHPYTRIEYIMKDLGVSRITATRYLDELAAGEFLVKCKIGRANYYINAPLYQLLTQESLQGEEAAEQ